MSKIKDSLKVIIKCKDKKGLIYLISKVFFDLNLNIEQNSEFTDKESNTFFMRSLLYGKINKLILRKKLEAILPQNKILKIISSKKKQIVIFVSKEFHIIGDILIKFLEKKLNADIKAIISNHIDLQNMVNKFNIPYHYVSFENINRENHEDIILKILKNINFDYIILAKYMRILTPNFINLYKNMIINIHHSFLPAFIGANPYQQAYDRGVKIIGATSHFVINDLDEGPIIHQDTILINHNQNKEDIKNIGRDIEKSVMSITLELLFNDKILITDSNKTVIF